MDTHTIIELVLVELDRSDKQHGDLPSDIVHGGAIVAEEAGELLKACLESRYEDQNKALAIREAIHTAAMAIKFIGVYA